MTATSSHNEPPFGSDSAVSVMFRTVSQPPDLGGVPDGELREVIAACLAKPPGDRPSARAILAALSGPVPPLIAAGAGPPAAGKALSTQTQMRGADSNGVRS